MANDTKQLKANDDMLQHILYRVTRYMIRRLEGEIGEDELISPQELNAMVKLLKDNGIRVKLTVDDTMKDPFGEMMSGLSPEDLDVPEAYKN